MASILRLFKGVLNSLLPFTNPNTPLIQDLIHSVALIALFYFAPKLTERASQTVRDRAEPQVRENATDLEEQEHANGERPQQHAFVEDDIGDESDDEQANDLRDLPQFPGAAVPGVEGQPGPAIDGPNPHQPPPRRDRDRAVGKKKAASIARRDQRRAYHEQMRAQGDVQRAENARIEREQEEALFEEKRRRAAIEMEVEERNRREREEDKKRIESQRQREYERRDMIVRRARDGLGSHGFVDLNALGERSDVEILIRAAGLLGTRQGPNGKELTMITAEGWLVTVTEQTMICLYKRVLQDQSGKVSFQDAGIILEEIMKIRKG